MKKNLKYGLMAMFLCIGSISYVADATNRDGGNLVNNTTQTSVDSEKGVRDLVEKFYSEIIPLVNNCKSYNSVIESYFSPEFVNLYTTIDEDVPDGDMGFFDYDFITNSNDPDVAKAVVKSIKISKNSAGQTVADVKVSLMSKVYEPTPIELVLTETPKGWKISDYNKLLGEMKEFKQMLKNNK